MINWRLGTMGFSDPDWVGTFYPRGIKSGEHLPFYSRFFNTIELDTTFHAEPTIERIERWIQSVPEDFRFSVKTPKAITHADVLDAAAAVAMRRFLALLETFGKKLGVVLVQFPPTFAAISFASLEAFLASIDARLNLAIEFRNKSWDTDRTEKLLRDHRCIWVAGDYLDEPWAIRQTADDLYIRWIGKHEQFATHEREQLDMSDRLQWWKKRVEALPNPPKNVWGFLNNDFSGNSLTTANRMRHMLGQPAPMPTNADRGELFG
jgi:uncharacterized protein YecE (DUF72 family)